MAWYHFLYFVFIEKCYSCVSCVGTSFCSTFLTSSLCLFLIPFLYLTYQFNLSVVISMLLSLLSCYNISFLFSLQTRNLFPFKTTFTKNNNRSTSPSLKASCTKNRNRRFCNLLMDGLASIELKFLFEAYSPHIGKFLRLVQSVFI